MKLFDQLKEKTRSIKSLIKRALGREEEQFADVDVVRVARFLNVTPDVAEKLPLGEFEAILATLKGILHPSKMQPETAKERRARLREAARDRRRRTATTIAFLRRASEDKHKAELQMRKDLRWKPGQRISFNRDHDKLVRGKDGKPDTVSVQSDPEVYIVGRGGMWVKHKNALALAEVREKNGGKTLAARDMSEKRRNISSKRRRENDRRRMRSFPEWLYRQRMDALFDGLDQEAA